MTYAPRGYPKAAIEFLQAKPAGTRLTTAEISAAIDLEPANFGSTMAHALGHGLIVRHPDPSDGRRWLWSLGDGTPQPRERDTDTLDGKPLAIPQFIKPTTGGARRSHHARKPSAATVAHVGGHQPAPEQPAEPAQQTVDDGTAEMTLALWSNGMLEVRRHADDIVIFTEAQTRKIVAYLDRLSVASA